MRIALTGATGQVGAFIAAAALRHGHSLTMLGRHLPLDIPGGAAFQRWSLGEAPDLTGFDALIHAAFAHVPGRYRGGEGDDPQGFRRDNLAGSLTLFRAAAKAGVPRGLFLSSRAVFDGYPPGTLLTEAMPTRPASLYGAVKAEVETALNAMATPRFHPVILRATGVYGRAAPHLPHKWDALIAQMLAGQQVEPRVSTEIHGADLAEAVLRALAVAAPSDPPRATICHASDIMLDRHDLALAVARISRSEGVAIPPRQDAGAVSVLDCSYLRAQGWRPGGWARLQAELADMLAP